VEEEERSNSSVMGTSSLESGNDTILVIEKSTPLRHAIQAGLESGGYDVITAINWQRALDTVKAQDIDLMLIDIDSPHSGREELLAAIRAASPFVGVIAPTGQPTAAEVRDLQSVGFSDVLSKPFSIKDLEQVVRRVLRSRGRGTGRWRAAHR
jgi:DNA-binding NtrC family response regulator